MKCSCVVQASDSSAQGLGRGVCCDAAMRLNVREGSSFIISAQDLTEIALDNFCY